MRLLIRQPKYHTELFSQAQNDKMKLSSLPIASFLSVILAMPAPDAAVDETMVPTDAVEAQGYSEKRELPKKLFARDRVCRISGSGNVNCRTCPSTSCTATYYVVGGRSCISPSCIILF